MGTESFGSSEVNRKIFPCVLPNKFFLSTRHTRQKTTTSLLRMGASKSKSVDVDELAEEQEEVLAKLQVQRAILAKRESARVADVQDEVRQKKLKKDISTVMAGLADAINDSGDEESEEDTDGNGDEVEYKETADSD
jgi:hypothetical protein